MNRFELLFIALEKSLDFEDNQKAKEWLKEVMQESNAGDNNAKR